MPDMIPDYKPSKVYLGTPPLGACYRKAEAECAAAILIWVCQVQGDEWSQFIPLKFMGEALDKALKSDPVPEPIASWNKNPFMRPDFELLVTYGFIGKSSLLGENGYLLLPPFFEAHKRWVMP